MTTATSVIWCSPTYNAEHYQQFNRRIYRAGQTKRTQVIHIAAENTWETDVYKKLSGKLGRMENLLTILKSFKFNEGTSSMNQPVLTPVRTIDELIDEKEIHQNSDGKAQQRA